jgi:hypothetical protein
MVKKKLLLATLFFLNPVLAAEGPRCSFGSTPLLTSVKIFPGGEAVFPWSMFNYYGDRVTYVNVTIPKTGWQIILNPQGTITLNPNFSSSNSFVKHPLTMEDVPSEEVNVRIKVPASEEVGVSKKIVLTANAFCNLSSGAVIPGIQGELEINVRVVDAESYFAEFHDNSYILKVFFIFVLCLVLLALIVKRKINNQRNTK